MAILRSDQRRAEPGRALQQGLGIRTTSEIAPKKRLGQRLVPALSDHARRVLLGLQ